YFVQHSEHLMPRIHQMRTDLAQYYQSTNPSIRLQYMTSLDEKINFQINGTELLGRDINVFTSSKVNHKQVVEQIRNIALNNNTAGASIFDLGTVAQAGSLAEINTAMKTIEEKAQKQLQDERNHEMELEKMRIQEEKDKLAAEQRFEAEENERNRENAIQVAEIRASVATGAMD